MLNEINQTQKDRSCMSPFMRHLAQSKSKRQKVQWWLPGAGRKAWNRELKFNGYRVSVLQDERSSEDGWW